MSGITDVVSGMFGGGNKPKALPAPQEPTPPPTIDEAAAAADADKQLNKRRGRLATFLTGSSGTGAALGSSPQESTLKRFLGA